MCKYDSEYKFESKPLYKANSYSPERKFLQYSRTERTYQGGKI